MNFYQNKTVWIIGGTSGIGLSIAQKLVLIEGCNVIVSGRNISKIQSIPQVDKITLDVTNAQSFSDVVDNILQKYSNIDIILFCAGTYEPMNIDSFNSNLAASILQTNLCSMVNFVANLPKFYGRCTTIGIISSVAGYFGMPNSLFYGASKAGLSHLVESLYIELKKYKIDVKLINPGFVKTPLTDKNNFKMPFIISPEKAANIVISKLSTKRFEIAFPLSFVLILKLFKIIPTKLRLSLFSKSSVR
jgi:short-subunit dehydrogenase